MRYGSGSFALPHFLQRIDLRLFEFLFSFFLIPYYARLFQILDDATLRATQLLHIHQVDPSLHDLLGARHFFKKDFKHQLVGGIMHVVVNCPPIPPKILNQASHRIDPLVAFIT